MSFRSKTIIGVAFIEAVSLTLLLIAMMGFLRDSHEVQVQRYSRATVSNFASMIQDSLLSMDLARLQSFSEEVTTESNIVYTRIIDSDERNLAHSGTSEMLDRLFTADTSLVAVDDGVFDISAEVIVAGQRYGRVEIGIAVDEIQAMFGQTLLWGLSIAGGEMLLVALFSLALGVYLTRQLAHLKKGAEKLSSGDLGYQVPVRGDDELAATAEAFNVMSSALRIRGEQLSAIFALSPDGFLSLDSDDSVRMVNPSLCSMLGIAAETLLGKKASQLETLLRDMSSPAQPFESISRVLELSGDQASPKTGRCIFETALMPKRSLQVLARRGNGSEVALLLHFRDISHERQVDRMKSEFLSTAAHELRTPMSSIFGFSEVLLHTQQTPEQQREILGIIHKQSALLVRIVNDLLDLSRIEAFAGKGLSLTETSLQQVVHESIGGFPPQQQPRIKVSFDGDDRLIIADVDKLQQALTNLVSNACKYSKNDQPVFVRTASRQHSGVVWVGVEVVDQGVGMSDEEMKHCFDRFWRADRSGHFPGTGLGLSLVKEIVELHDGQIELFSRPGEGTRVTMWFRSTV